MGVLRRERLVGGIETLRSSEGKSQEIGSGTNVYEGKVVIELDGELRRSSGQQEWNANCMQVKACKHRWLDGMAWRRCRPEA